jgi:hypothetical protein
VVDVRYKARLGNNLFQYALGRIVAEQLGFELRADPIPGFPNTAQHVRGACHEGPEEVLAGQRIDLDGVLANRSPRRVVLDGWFQRHEYYRPFREKIRDWLQFDAGIQVPDGNAEVVVNVRRTDYVQLGWALPFSFYKEALERLNAGGGTIWIVTDDHRDPFFRQFGPAVRFFHGTGLQQLLFMSRARHLVMSQSTFSWWPTFLGDLETVVCPDPSFGAWAAQGEAGEVALIERDRFLCLPCHEPYRPTPAEARYQSQRAFRRRAILALNRRLRLSLPVPAP